MAKANPALAPIENRTKGYADAHKALSETVADMNNQIDDIKRKNMKLLKKQVADAAQKHHDLQTEIEPNQQHFTAPRSITFYGIKVGMQKKKGTISYKSPEQVIKLMRKIFSEKECDLLIKTEEKPIKTAIDKLAVADLKKIGCTVTADTDQVLIKPADSNVDKVVAALIKEATSEQ